VIFGKGKETKEAKEEVVCWCHFAFSGHFVFITGDGSVVRVSRFGLQVISNIGMQVLVGR